MDFKTRWLTRLYLMLLEDRSQPGTLLTTGIDAGALATVIDRPPQLSERVIKRLQATEDIQVVSPALAQAETLLSAPTAFGGTTSAASQIQQVGQYAVNPAIHMPATGTPEKFSVGGRDMVRSKAVQKAAPTPTITRFDGGMSVSAQAESSLSVSTGEVGGALGGSKDNGGGTRAAVWAHYDTSTFVSPNISGATDQDDRVNDVAVGNAPGPCQDHTITAGVIGKTGSIRYYAPDGVGSFVRQLNMPGVNGERSEITAVAEHPVTGEIFAVGNRIMFPGPPVSTTSFVAKWDAPPGAGCTNNPFGPPTQFPTAMRLYPAPFAPGAAGTNSLNDIQIELGVGSGLEVSVVGTRQNGVPATPWQMVQVSQMTVALGSPNNLSVDFGSAAFGLSLAVDDGTAPEFIDCDGDTIEAEAVGVLGTRYVGGRLRSAGANLALDFSVVDDGMDPVCDWQRTWSGASPSTTFNPNIGFFGMTQDGPALYSSGGMRDLVFAPGLDTSFVQLTDTYTGGVVHWSWFYGAPGGHYYSKGNAVVPGGGFSADSYTAGSIDVWTQGTAGPTAGDAVQYDALGSLISFQSSGCPVVPNDDTDGKAVALHFNGDVSVGGITNASAADWGGANGPCPDGSTVQPLNSVDSIYGGSGNVTSGPKSDGYVFRMNTPLGP